VNRDMSYELISEKKKKKKKTLVQQLEGKGGFLLFTGGFSPAVGRGEESFGEKGAQKKTLRGEHRGGEGTPPLNEKFPHSD